MIIIICIDDSMGMLFNNRRLSRDSRLIKWVSDFAEGNILYIQKYSLELFEESSTVSIIKNPYELRESISSTDFVGNNMRFDTKFDDNIDRSIGNGISTDAVKDAGKNISTDAVKDAGKNISTDAVKDAGKNISTDAVKDAGKNISTDAVKDAGKNISTDAVKDAGKNISTDAVNSIFCGSLREQKIFFDEQIDPADFLCKGDELIVCHWNRAYPSDLKCSLNVKDFHVELLDEFEGSSHKKITIERWTMEH